ELAPAEEEVVGPGQEELLADILGRGAALPGKCTLAAGQIAGGVIAATYNCSGGEVVVELRHPAKAPAGARRTSRFAIVVRSGSPARGLLDALAARIRSREAAFQWTHVVPAPSPAPMPSPVPHATITPLATGSLPGPPQAWRWPDIPSHTAVG